MKNAALSFLLVVLIEAVSAVVAYLKERLMGNLRRSGNDDVWDNHPEFV
ncbi:hypothetical protein [Caballeronia sp. INSB1]|nr:hypothetical protein [Caballeronia sp. INSB1]